MTTHFLGYTAPQALAGTTPTALGWPGASAGPWDFTWVIPPNLLNGAVKYDVFGSPGQNIQLGNVPSPVGLGAYIEGWYPCKSGDTHHVYIADGGPTGYATRGYHKGGQGGTGYNTGGTGGLGGGSSAVYDVTNTKVIIEAAGGGGDGGWPDSAHTNNLSGQGGAAGLGTGIQGAPGTPGGALLPTLTNPAANPGQNAAGTVSAAPTNGGAGGAPLAGGTGFGEAGLPTGAGPNSGGLGGNGGGAPADGASDGGGGGGGGGAAGGGGGAGGYNHGGGAGGGAGLGAVDSTVYSVSYAGYSDSYGTVFATYVTADPPLAPTLMIPGDTRYWDMANNGLVQFQYNPGEDSGTINQWAFRRQNVTTSGAVEYWDAANQVWNAAIVWNSATLLLEVTANQFQYLFPNGQWIDGDQYHWSIATTEGFYNLGTAAPVFATNFTVNAELPPVVTITSSAAFTTVTPTITWTNVLPGGTTQQGAQIQIFTLKQTQQPGFNPVTAIPLVVGSVIGAATNWTVTPAIPPGLYVVYVVVTDTHNVYNNYNSFQQFSIRLQVFTAPTLTATPGLDPNNQTPCVILQVTPAAGAQTAVTVQRSLDGGTTWTYVYECTAAPWAGGTLTLYDRTCPMAKPTGPNLWYRAEVNGTTVISTVTYPAVSPWSATAGPVHVDLSGIEGWTMSDPLNGGGAPSPSYQNPDGTYPVPQVPIGGSGAGTALLHRIAGTAGGGSTAPSGGIQDYEVSVEVDQAESQTTINPLGRSMPMTMRGDLYQEIFSSGIQCLFIGQQEFDTWNQIRGRRGVVCIRSDMGQVYFGVLGSSRNADMIRSAERTTLPYRQLGFNMTPANPPPIPNQPVS